MSPEPGLSGTPVKDYAVKADAVDAPRPLVRFLVHGAERSGPPIYMLRILREWARTTVPFDVEAVIARPGPLTEEFASTVPTRVTRLDQGSPDRRAERILDAAHLHGLAGRLIQIGIRQRVGPAEPELTVVNGATAPTVQLLAALNPKGKVVTIAHELSTGWFSNLTTAERDLLLVRTRAFLAVSESVRSFLVDRLGVRADQVTVVPPPVDVAGLAGGETAIEATGSPLVAGMGVTDWRKAPETWLRIAHLVKSHPGHDDVRFVWVGGDSPGASAFWPLEHEMTHLELHGHVEFTGAVAEPWSIARKASVFVSTAREDAYPLACAEAIARGIPVAGFDVDGVGEMVRDSGCGVVVPYPDEPALADAVVRLIEDPQGRAAMSRLGKRFAETSTEVRVVATGVSDWLTEQIT